MAGWDLRAKLEDRPLYRVLADRFNDGSFDPMVQVYAAGGYYYDEDGLERLGRELVSYLDSGYDCAKIKVGGAAIEEDLERIGLAVDLLGSPGKLGEPKCIPEFLNPWVDLEIESIYERVSHRPLNYPESDGNLNLI